MPRSRTCPRVPLLSPPGPLYHPRLVESVHRGGNIQHQHDLGALTLDAVLVGGKGGFLAEIDGRVLGVDGLGIRRHGGSCGLWAEGLG